MSALGNGHPAPGELATLTGGLLHVVHLETRSVPGAVVRDELKVAAWVPLTWLIRIPANTTADNHRKGPT